jgi:hypothetical protein
MDLRAVVVRAYPSPQALQFFSGQERLKNKGSIPTGKTGQAKYQESPCEFLKSSPRLRLHWTNR